jgi:hypothetical protein
LLDEQRLRFLDLRKIPASGKTFSKPGPRRMGVYGAAASFGCEEIRLHTEPQYQSSRRQ